MKKHNLTKKVYTTYLEKSDITIILEDTFGIDENLVSTEIKGFYYGKPNKEDVKKYYGHLKAEFD